MRVCPNPFQSKHLELQDAIEFGDQESILSLTDLIHHGVARIIRSRLKVGTNVVSASGTSATNAASNPGPVQTRNAKAFAENTVGSGLFCAFVLAGSDIGKVNGAKIDHFFCGAKIDRFFFGVEGGGRRGGSRSTLANPIFGQN